MNDPYYNSRYTFDPARKIVWREIVRYLAPFLQGVDNVMDLGAGYCDFINTVTAKRRVAVDSSPELKNFAAAGVETIQGMVWELSNVPSASIDVIHASNLLEHLTDQELDKVMKEVRRTLKLGGRLILIQPNYRYCTKHYFDDPTHKKVFSHESLVSFLISQGLRICRVEPKFLPFSMKSRPSIIPIHTLMVRAYLCSPFKPGAGQMLVVAEYVNEQNGL